MIKKIWILSLLLVSCVSTIKRDIATNEAVVISLDAHVHLNQPFIESNRNGYQEALDNKSVGHSFLLSDTFGSWAINSSRSISHKEASAIVGQYPNQFTGFCGLNLAWSDGVKIIKECLALPGMKGIKIHDYSLPDSFLLSDKYKNLATILESVKTKKVIILWHLKTDKAEKDLSYEYDQILQFAQAYSNITFIIAHGFDIHETEKPLIMFNQKLSKFKVRPKNLYTEISTLIDICEYPLSDSQVISLKQFGVDYLLIGSDSSSRTIDGSLLLMEVKSFVKSQKLLSDEEKIKILIKNGLDILRQHNQAAYKSVVEKIPSNAEVLDRIQTLSCEQYRKLIDSL